MIIKREGGVNVEMNNNKLSLLSLQLGSPRKIFFVPLFLALLLTVLTLLPIVTLIICLVLFDNHIQALNVIKKNNQMLN